jgi:small-conductance mechanosensitive channel
MTRTAIVLSKVFILLMAAAGLFVQFVMLPIQAAESAADNPDLAFLRVPLLIAGVLFVFCGQVVLACVWMLLSLVRREVIFTVRAFKFVNIMIGALLVAAAVIVVALLTMELTADAGEPGFFVLALGLAFGCAALALVVFVMRGLLVKASEQASYLEEVV